MSNRTEKTHNSVPTAYSYGDAGQMTATQALAGGAAPVAPSAAVCAGSLLVYGSASRWQVYRAETTVGKLCTAATSAFALQPWVGGVTGIVIDSVNDYTGALCEPGTAYADSTTIDSDSAKEGDNW